MSYKAVRFSAGRTGWAVVVAVYSPNGKGKRTVTIRRNLTRRQANDIAKRFSKEVGA